MGRERRPIEGNSPKSDPRGGRFLGGVDDAGIARSLEYASFEGQRDRNTDGDILTQLFGHSWYHRGQIALLIRSIGAEPAITDFVFWTREPIPPPDARGPH